MDDINVFKYYDSIGVGSMLVFNDMAYDIWLERGQT